MAGLKLSANPVKAPVLTAQKMLPHPGRPRHLAGWISIGFLLCCVALAVFPWQQSVPGKGRVIAYAPLERQQTLEAPVKGRIVQWWVEEGSKVEKGDRLVEIADNDPAYLQRLERDREAILVQLQNYDEQVLAIEQRINALIEKREHKVRVAQADVRIAQRDVEAADQDVEAADAKLETTLLNLARQRTLFSQGLSAERSLELAVLAETQARTSRNSKRQKLAGKRRKVNAAESKWLEARADASASIESARASLFKIRSQRAETVQKRNKIDTRLARQQQQIVTAPRAGTVLRILTHQGGEQVKPGDGLMVFVPNGQERAVELWVDGNDAALLSPGRDVRLQFEGWPAVQFSGWPSVAVGTFGGSVVFIDSADDGAGNFRVVVRPNEHDDPWPDNTWLRQGVRANGFVLLEQVSLGFEFWRQLNDFPPTILPPGSSKSNPKKSRKGPSSKGASKP